MGEREQERWGRGNGEGGEEGVRKVGKREWGWWGRGSKEGGGEGMGMLGIRKWGRCGRVIHISELQDRKRQMAVPKKISLM